MNKETDKYLGQFLSKHAADGPEPFAAPAKPYKPAKLPPVPRAPEVGDAVVPPKPFVPASDAFMAKKQKFFDTKVMPWLKEKGQGRLAPYQYFTAGHNLPKVRQSDSVTEALRRKLFPMSQVSMWNEPKLKLEPIPFPEQPLGKPPVEMSDTEKELRRLDAINQAHSKTPMGQASPERLQAIDRLGKDLAAQPTRAGQFSTWEKAMKKLDPALHEGREFPEGKKSVELYEKLRERLGPEKALEMLPEDDRDRVEELIDMGIIYAGTGGSPLTKAAALEGFMEGYMDKRASSCGTSYKSKKKKKKKATIAKEAGLFDKLTDTLSGLSGSGAEIKKHYGAPATANELAWTEARKGRAAPHKIMGKINDLGSHAWLLDPKRKAEWQRQRELAAKGRGPGNTSIWAKDANPQVIERFKRLYSQPILLTRQERMDSNYGENPWWLRQGKKEGWFPQSARAGQGMSKTPVPPSQHRQLFNKYVQNIRRSGQVMPASPFTYQEYTPTNVGSQNVPGVFK